MDFIPPGYRSRANRSDSHSDTPPQPVHQSTTRIVKTSTVITQSIPAPTAISASPVASQPITPPIPPKTTLSRPVTPKTPSPRSTPKPTPVSPTTPKSPPAVKPKKYLKEPRFLTSVNVEKRPLSPDAPKQYSIYELKASNLKSPKPTSDTTPATKPTSKPPSKDKKSPKTQTKTSSFVAIIITIILGIATGVGAYFIFNYFK